MSLLNSIMQGSSDALRELFADSSMLPLTLLFLAVFIGILAVPRLVTSRSPVQRRLAPTGQVTQVEGAPSLRPGESTSMWSQILAGLEKRAIPTNEKERTTARVRLLQAGYAGPNVVRNYFAINLKETVETDWREKTRYYGRYLPFPQRHLINALTYLPADTIRFLIRKKLSLLSQ